jgi:plastocyanin
MRPRTLPLAAILAACALAAAGCGDDDDSDNAAGDSGGGGDSGGSVYGGGGGDDKAKEDEQASGGGSGGGGGASTLKLAADPSGALKFDKTSLTAKAGKVTIDFENTSGVPHAVEVEGGGVEEETETITDGTSKLTVDLKKGEYVFYCPVGNHRGGGMEGTLTVE